MDKGVRCSPCFLSGPDMRIRDPQRWQQNGVNKARRARKSGRLLDFCYRAASGAGKAIFDSDEGFNRFCAANKKGIGGVMNEDCQGCKITGIPGNVEIGGAVTNQPAQQRPPCK